MHRASTAVTLPPANLLAGLLHRFAALTGFLVILLVILSIGSGKHGLCSEYSGVPNIVLILADDLGYGDLSIYGNKAVETKRLDQLARQGVRFTQFYVNSPICSPSRVALMTGQYPQRWSVFGHFASRAQNRARGMVDYLDPQAVTLARLLKQAGYATAHFGKWHMGGGRDVGDAPHPQVYGFDESLVSMEGLGDRILEPEGDLDDASAQLGQGTIRRVPKHQMTSIWADRVIDFVRRHRDQPFYVNFWPRDVHDPFKPSEEQTRDIGRVEQDLNRREWEKFFAVLAAMDRQIGRVVDAVDGMGLGEKTMIVVTGDNGPTAWSHYYQGGKGEGAAPGLTGGLRGRKWSLYEGGLREPLIVRWSGTIPAGTVNRETVMAAVDLLPSLCALAGVSLPEGYEPDGLDLSEAMLGRAAPARSRPLFWEYNSLGGNIRPGLKKDQSPNLAMRDGDWKLLLNADGTGAELYNLACDPTEADNLASRNSERVATMRPLLLGWYHAVTEARRSGRP